MRYCFGIFEIKDKGRRQHGDGLVVFYEVYFFVCHVYFLSNFTYI